MDCPRCAVPMLRHRTQPPGYAHPFELDECERCRGVWLDRGEADLVAPIVAALERRHLEIVTLGSLEGGLSRCPRCAEVPYTFFIIDLEIDYCPGCSGVWLDGPEAEEHYKPREGQITTGGRGPYRAVQRAAETDRIRCADCREVVALAQCTMSGRGLICWPCRRELLMHAAVLREKYEYSLIDQDVPDFDDLPDPVEPGAKEPFLTSFLGALLDVLAARD